MWLPLGHSHLVTALFAGRRELDGTFLVLCDAGLPRASSSQGPRCFLPVETRHRTRTSRNFRCVLGTIRGDRSCVLPAWSVFRHTVHRTGGLGRFPSFRRATSNRFHIVLRFLRQFALPGEPVL